MFQLQDFQRKKEGPSSIPVAAPSEYHATSALFSAEQPSQDPFSEVSDQNAYAPAVTSQFLHNTSHAYHSNGSNEGANFNDQPSTPVNGQQYSTFKEDVPTAHDSFMNIPAPSTVQTDAISTDAPAVFSASAYFSNCSNDSFTAGGHDSTQGIFSSYPASHFFPPSDDRLDCWNTNLSSSIVSTDLTTNQSSDGVADVISYHQSAEKQPASLSEDLQNSSVFTEDTLKAAEEEHLQNNSKSSYENDMTERKESMMPVNGRSSTESIRQLTDQITQLFDPSIEEEAQTSSTLLSSLEMRNQELAAQLETERRTNQQLQFVLKESQSQVSHLELKVQDLQAQQEVVLARHLGPLQEQLRAHAQTVGILVGEKTELEAAIAHHTTTAKQHAGEVEELQNRLRASRHRVSELEKELASVTATASAADKQKNNHVQEVDQLRLQNGMLSKQLEDAEEEASELRQKLSARVSEVGLLTTQLQEKQSQLSLSQLRVTQLSASDNPEASAEIESLHQMKISLERRCTELTETVRQLSADRDQADQQYQQYVAQLNGQLQSASSKLESMSLENERLKSREVDLVQNMSELERQLQQQIQSNQQQQLQHNQLQQQPQQNTEASSNDTSSLLEKISLLEQEKLKLQSTLDSEAEELVSLRAEVEEKDSRIADLETLCSERPDQSRLLAAMESDKVAAAQATSQNAVLKQQLLELQYGFIKMSNEKLNLTEGLEHEKHVNKEMGEKISQLAEELHELRVSVSEKERRLQEYRKNEPDRNHDHVNCNENHDHDHDHGDNIKENSKNEKQSSQITTALQEQLNQAQEHIHNLNSQNNSLRRLIAQKSTESHESGSSSSATEGATTDDAGADPETNCEDGSDGHNNYSCMQFAMEKLQERFTRTMAEVAELSDEKQRLEHLVLQLQGETETIGEYVALYQMQRAALQQRAREKDHQLANISAEREELRRKLQELNHLVQTLLNDRGMETAKEALPTIELSNDNTIDKNDSDVIEVPTETVGLETNSNQDVAKRLTKQILSIIDDIEVTNAVEASFHPCPWCSGRLKNV